MKRYLWLGLTVLVIITGIFLFINLSRPPISTAAPVSEQEKWRIVGPAEQYLGEKLMPKTGQGQGFAAFDLFGIEETKDTVKAYGWCLALELDRNQQMHTGISVPVMLEMKKANGGYQVVRHWLPGDGSEYWPSIQKEFPKQYQDAVRNRQGRVKDLEEQIQKKAKEYFSKKSN